MMSRTVGCARRQIRARSAIVYHSRDCVSSPRVGGTGAKGEGGRESVISGTPSPLLRGTVDRTERLGQSDEAARERSTAGTRHKGVADSCPPCPDVFVRSPRRGECCSPP